MSNDQNETTSLSNTQKVITSLIAGAFAGATAKTIIAPFDRAKINFQVRRDKFSYSRCFKFIQDTYRNEGFIRLYRGNSANLARVIPAAAIYFTAHEQWKRLLNTDKYEKTPGRRFIAGSLAGLTSSTIVYPLDLARARMAVTNKTVYTNLFTVFRIILRTEGVVALYRGALSSMIGVLPYSGCVFFTYESLKHIRLDYQSHRPITTTERMVFGAISGLIGQTASYPFDVVRRRLQTAAVIRPDERSLGAIATTRKIIREEGITCGLYKGVTMNWLKGPISMTTNISLSFTDLPLLVQEKIIKSFSYTELSRLRSISKHFHRLCSEQLNRGYFQLEIIIHDLQKQIKTKLPRRESERHKHPLSTKFDIISSLDSRIQWLKLTFGSAIQNSYCCFYPGRLLDEIYSVLDRLKIQQSFSNPCTLLQETRDMSSMAIEHFREQIKPKLQSLRITSLTTIRNNVSTFSTTNNNSLSHYHKRSTNRILRRQIDILNNRIYKQNFVIKSQKYQMKHYKQLLHMRTKSLINHHKRLKYLEKKSKESEQMLLEIRKDNDTLLQRLDQFILAYDNISTEINNKKSDEIFSQINMSLKRRKID
ncbi:unnamed protein product [Rotaria sordida]|uniref:F-box domain-containing protein n=1 Tax=Rotaria sordida TaxID=392033 RepID=A0A818L4V1_9BILA|nr:unnamed protein product [Rotaria sordida]CAF0861743.1 unnamed protein product [Rotaria sordida]CAF0919653.1 unnamed protein product [Rotaria sordida]CAF0927724.1 unnamed protein product [Rotaria sordida]CAF1137011.1 unnamed protein product [Rotaria sordida]